MLDLLADGGVVPDVLLDVHPDAGDGSATTSAVLASAFGTPCASGGALEEAAIR